MNEKNLEKSDTQSSCICIGWLHSVRKCQFGNSKEGQHYEGKLSKEKIIDNNFWEWIKIEEN